MLILHNKSIQQHSGTSQTKMRLGLLREDYSAHHFVHQTQIIPHCVNVFLGLSGSLRFPGCTQGQENRLMNNWPSSHWTASMAHTNQFNMAVMLHLKKKNLKQNPAPLKLDACTIHALLSNLQQPDTATAWVPSLQREVNTHQWEKEYSFLPHSFGWDIMQNNSFLTLPREFPLILKDHSMSIC